MAERRRRFPRASWGLLLWLALVWVLLWGDFTPANVVVGFIVGLVVTEVMPLPRTPFNGGFRLWGVILLAARFAWDVIVASWQVSEMVVTGRRPQGAVIRVRLRSQSDIYLTIVSALTALVPGSVVVEAHRFSSTLYVHIFDVPLQGGLEEAHRRVLAQEERVLRALASDDELRAAGFEPGSSPRAGRSPAHQRSAISRAADAELAAREAGR